MYFILCYIIKHRKTFWKNNLLKKSKMPYHLLVPIQNMYRYLWTVQWKHLLLLYVYIITVTRKVRISFKSFIIKYSSFMKVFTVKPNWVRVKYLLFLIKYMIWHPMFYCNFLSHCYLLSPFSIVTVFNPFVNQAFVHPV